MAYMSGMTSYMHIRLGKRLKLGQSRRSMPSRNQLEPVNKVMSKGQHLDLSAVDIQPRGQVTHWVPEGTPDAECKRNQLTEPRQSLKRKGIRLPSDRTVTTKFDQRVLLLHWKPLQVQGAFPGRSIGKLSCACEIFMNQSSVLNWLAGWCPDR